MGLRKWLNKPSEPGSIKWHIQVGETDPVKIAKSKYETQKQQYENKLDIGEKVIVGKFLIGLSIIFFILAIFFLYSNIWACISFMCFGISSLLFFVSANWEDTDGKG